MRTAARRVTNLVIFLIASLIVVTGCTSAADRSDTSSPQPGDAGNNDPIVVGSEWVDPDPSWVEPEWMAEAREEIQRTQTEMLSCLAASGIQGVPDIGMGVVSLPTARDADGNFDRALMDHFIEVSDKCNETLDTIPAQFPQPPDFTVNVTLDSYQRMLDVRDCLIAHGQPIPEAPQFEVWNPRLPTSNPWNFADFIGPNTDNLARLMTACPQDGMSLPISFAVFTG